MRQHLDLQVEVAGAAVGRAALAAETHLRSGAHTARDSRLDALAVLPLERPGCAVESLFPGDLDGGLLVQLLDGARVAAHSVGRGVGAAEAGPRPAALPAAPRPARRRAARGVRPSAPW